MTENKNSKVWTQTSMFLQPFDADPNSELSVQMALYNQANIVAEAYERTASTTKARMYRQLAAKHAEWIYKNIANRKEHEGD